MNDRTNLKTSLIMSVSLLGMALTIIANADPNLVCRWKLDEGSGSTVVNNTGSYTDPNYNLIIGMGVDANHDPIVDPNNDPCWVNDPCRGWCLWFDGNTGHPQTNYVGDTGDYLLGPALNLNSNTVTLSAWIKPDPWCIGMPGKCISWEQKGIFTGLIHTRDANSASGLWYGGLGFSGYTTELGYEWNGEPATWKFSSDILVPDWQWSLVAVVIEPNQANLYLGDFNDVNNPNDDVLYTTTHSSINEQDEWDGIFAIACDGGLIDGGWETRFFRGSMSDIRIYNRALDINEIDNLFRGCIPEYTLPIGDFTGDCIIDYADFDIMADEWLISDYEGAPQPPAKAPIIEYLFDEGSGDTVYNTGSYSDPCYNLTIGLYLDANGNSFIHPNHAPLWADDPCRGWCLFFDGEGGMWPGVAPIQSEQFLGGDYLVMPALNLQTETFSITAWIKPNPDFGKAADEFKGAFTGIVTTRKHSSINPSVGTEGAGLHYGFGGYCYCGMLAYTWNDGNPDTWNWASDIFPVDLEWNFVAVTIEPDQATIYDVNESAGALEIASNVILHSSVLLDAKWIIAGDIGHLRFFKGWMDDIRIYDYTLSTDEIMNLAGVEGIVYFPNRSVANIVPKTPPPENYDPNNPDIVNFLDYSILADNWLKEHLWPPEP